MSCRTPAAMAQAPTRTGSSHRPSCPASTSETQAVAVGVFVDGMEHEEIAGILGISRRTVSRKLDRFVENARKFLARSDSGSKESDEAVQP